MKTSFALFNFKAVIGYFHELEKVVSEWRSVIAVSLNVGGGVRFIKPAKLYMCTQNTTNTTRTHARHGVCAAMVPTAEPLGECRYENWNTHTQHMYISSWACMVVQSIVSLKSLVQDFLSLIVLTKSCSCQNIFAEKL